jgi:hypothetical protein
MFLPRISRPRLLAIAVAVSSTLGATVLSGARADDPYPGYPFVKNFGAETTDTNYWTATGVTAIHYPPLDANSSHGNGYFIFANPGGTGSLVQSASLAEVADRIDGGTEQLVFFALLGGTGSANAQVSYQMRDGSGVALGPSVQLGPPSAGDRQDRSIIECQITVTPPVGTRSVDVTVTGVPGSGSALADDVLVQHMAHPVLGSQGPPTEQAEGPNCYRNVAPAATPTATPSPTVTPEPTVTVTPTVSPTSTPTPAPVRFGSMTRRHVTFRLRVGVRVRVKIARRGHGRWRGVIDEKIPSGGDRTVHLRYPRLKDGRYRVSIGAPSETPVVRFKRFS